MTSNNEWFDDADNGMTPRGPERRRYSHMDDIKGKLDRIEITTNAVHTGQKIMENSFGKHELQNERDFNTIEKEHRERFAMVAEEIKDLKREFGVVKQTVTRWSGALVLLVPIVTWAMNHWIGK